MDRRGRVMLVTANPEQCRSVWSSGDRRVPVARHRCATVQTNDDLMPQTRSALPPMCNTPRSIKPPRSTDRETDRPARAGFPVQLRALWSLVEIRAFPLKSARHPQRVGDLTGFIDGSSPGVAGILSTPLWAGRRVVHSRDRSGVRLADSDGQTADAASSTESRVFAPTATGVTVLDLAGSLQCG